MRLIPFVVALLVCGVDLLSAQTITSPYRYIEQTHSLGPFGGYLATDRGDDELAPHSAPLVGLRYNGRISGPVSGEVGVAFLSTKRTLRQVDAEGTALESLGDVDSQLLTAEVGLKFQLTGPRTWRSLAPYIGATGGLIMDLAKTSELEKAAELSDTERIEFGPAFAVGASAGTDWFLTDRLSVRAAGQGYLWRFTTPAGLAGRETTAWLRNFGATLGLAVHF